MNWIFEPLRPLNYDLIMADPPWKFTHRSVKGQKKAAEAKYSTMPIEEICKLPVGQLATRDAILWLWATWPTLDRAPEVIRAWGFRYVTGGVWLKTTKTGKDCFGTGYRFRSCCEPFLVGTMGDPITTRSERNLFRGLRRVHSQKPEEAYQFVERWFPQGMNRLELFSRSTRPGWDAWGNETGKLDKEAA